MVVGGGDIYCQEGYCDLVGPFLFSVGCPIWCSKWICNSTR